MELDTCLGQIQPAFLKSGQAGYSSTRPNQGLKHPYPYLRRKEASEEEIIIWFLQLKALGPLLDEVNSTYVFRRDQGHSCPPWWLTNEIKETQMILSSLHVSFHHILREWNEEADLLAKAGLKHDSLVVSNVFSSMNRKFWCLPTHCSNEIPFCCF